MNRLSIIVLCFLALAGAGVCDIKGLKAVKAAAEHADMLRQGRYDELADGYWFPPDTTAEAANEERKACKEAMLSDLHPMIRSKGGLHKSRVVRRTVSDDGHRATVVVNHEFHNGQRENQLMIFRMSNGRWKLSGGHLRDVWHTHTHDGLPVSIELRRAGKR